MRNTSKSTRGKRLMIPPINLSNGQNGARGGMGKLYSPTFPVSTSFPGECPPAASLFFAGEPNLPRQFQIAFPKQSTTTAGGDPAAPHQSAPALDRGQLHAHLARC